MQDTSTYPNLFAELLARGWTEPELEKLAGGNLLRVFRGTERVDKFVFHGFVWKFITSFTMKKVRDEMAARGAQFDAWIPKSDVPEEALPCSSGDSLRSSILSVDPAEV